MFQIPDNTKRDGYDHRAPRAAEPRLTNRVLTVVLLAASVCQGQVSAQDEPGDWKQAMAQRIARHPGDTAVVVRHWESSEQFEHRENEVFPTASLIKLPIMIEAYRQDRLGRLSLNDPVVLRDEDKVPGSGILTSHFSAGATFPLRDAIRLMMAWSDNTATNLVIDRIGMEATTKTMRSLGCPETRLHSKVFRRDTSIDLERSQKYGLGSTTASEMSRLLEQLLRRELVDEEASAAMRAHLAACQDRSMFPRHLPSGARVEHKTGGVTGVRADAGFLIGPGGTVIVCVLTKNNRREEGQTEDSGELLCADIASIAYRRFHPPHLAARAPVIEEQLSIGASGHSVMELQKALNERLNPSPSLDVDGEFGPLTRAAVERFQATHQLKTTGIVDAETRLKLWPDKPRP